MSLAAFIVRRLLWTIPLILLVMLATFALMRGSGGTPFQPPEGFVGVPYTLERDLREFYNLDEPWLVEFATYVKNVASLSFGPSLVNRHLTVDQVIEVSFPVTLELVALAAAWAVPVGILLGLLAALRRNSVTDALATSLASVFLVVPVFFLAYVLSHYLVLEWKVVPGGWDGWRSKLVPVLVLGLAPAGYVARLIRTAVVETLQEDYVRTAVAKGLRRRRIVGVHVLRNSLVPMLSAAVPMLALLITGALFVEQYFGIPGASPFFISAARSKDYPLLMGLTVALAIVVLVANAVADILMALADPRVREQGLQ